MTEMFKLRWKAIEEDNSKTQRKHDENKNKSDSMQRLNYQRNKKVVIRRWLIF